MLAYAVSGHANLRYFEDLDILVRGRDVLRAKGVLERDGYWVATGLAAATLAAVVTSGVVWAMFKAASYLIARLFQ